LQNEKYIIENARADPRLFGELYDAYYPKIFGYLFRITGDYSVSCDICSETFLKAWINLGSFTWKGISISSWFFKIATNELNQYFRKKKYHPYSLIDLSVLEIEYPDSLSRSDDMILKRDQDDEFKNVLQKLKLLPPKYQKVIALKYFEEMSIREIGEILGKKEGTVKSLLSRGLGKLKNKFSQTATCFPEKTL
jgi:RNA polymerase sigma-70 factor (ECF subfamily)